VAIIDCRHIILVEEVYFAIEDAHNDDSK